MAMTYESLANSVSSVGVDALCLLSACSSDFFAALIARNCMWSILLVAFDSDCVGGCSSSGSNIPRSRLTALPNRIVAGEALSLEFISEFKIRCTKGRTC